MVKLKNTIIVLNSIKYLRTLSSAATTTVVTEEDDAKMFTSLPHASSSSAAESPPGDEEDTENVDERINNGTVQVTGYVCIFRETFCIYRVVYVFNMVSIYKKRIFHKFIVFIAKLKRSITGL